MELLLEIHSVSWISVSLILSWEIVIRYHNSHFCRKIPVIARCQATLVYFT